MVKEPVGVGTVLAAVIPAVIAILTAFNIWHDPTQAQLASITGAEAAVVVIIGLFVRAKVSPIAQPGEK